MIQVEHLTKRYRGTVAVQDLSFEVRPGAVTGFLGPNGSGKSTTMRAIMGLARPDQGRSLINGRAYRDLPWPLREVGALLDARAFHPGRSAQDHLLALAQANAIDTSRVQEVIEIAGLTSVAHKRAGTFSLGMGQRLGIAATLLGDPGVLLFDEPINGLDPDGIRWVRNLVRKLAAEGRTILLSSHMISEMSLVADQLVVIGRGRLLAELSMDEFAAQAPRSVKVRTPEPERLTRVLLDAGMGVALQPGGSLSVTGADAGAIARQARVADIAIDELTPEHASLEDAFIALTHASTEFAATANRVTHGAIGARVDQRRRQ